MKKITAAVWLAAILLAGCAVPGETPPAQGTAQDTAQGPAQGTAQSTAADTAEKEEETAETAADERGEEEMRRENDMRAKDGKGTPGEKARPSVLTEENGREYSADTLIVQLDPETDEAGARELAERHGLEIVYLYRSFSSMAVKTPSPLTAEEMDALMEELEGEEGVLGVGRDYITRLDDPVRPPELMG